MRTLQLSIFSLKGAKKTIRCPCYSLYFVNFINKNLCIATENGGGQMRLQPPQIAKCCPLRPPYRAQSLGEEGGRARTQMELIQSPVPTSRPVAPRPAATSFALSRSAIVKTGPHTVSASSSPCWRASGGSKGPEVPHTGRRFGIRSGLM